MSKKAKAIARLRANPKNVRFREIDDLLCNMDFEKRTSGSHATYIYPGLPPITIPFRKPFILPVYVKHILELLDQLEEE